MMQPNYQATLIDTAELRDLAHLSDAVNAELNDLRVFVLQLPAQLPPVDPFGEISAYGQADPSGRALLEQASARVQQLQAVIDTDRRTLIAEADHVDAEEGAPPATAPRSMSADGTSSATGAVATHATTSPAPWHGDWVTTSGAVVAGGAFVAAAGHPGGALSAPQGGARVVTPGTEVDAGAPLGSKGGGQGQQPAGAPSSSSSLQPRSLTPSGSPTGEGTHLVPATDGSGDGSGFNPFDLGQDWAAIQSIAAGAWSTAGDLLSDAAQFWDINNVSGVFAGIGAAWAMILPAAFAPGLALAPALSILAGSSAAGASGATLHDLMELDGSGASLDQLFPPKDGSVVVDRSGAEATGRTVGGGFKANPPPKHRP